jgi:hypothetical protein
MGVGRAQDCGVQGSGPHAEVVDEATTPGKQRSVFYTLN